jgi:crotonobetainyl-CoA:carnitine CoA-transferase CaiB-like acyl-CoA transferase
MLRIKQKEQEKSIDDDAGGVLIDVSMTSSTRSLSILQETVRHNLTEQLAEKSESTNLLSEGGNFILSGASPCYRFYPTKDERLIAVGCLELPFWLKFLKLLMKHCSSHKENLEKYSNPKTAKMFQFANITDANQNILSSSSKTNSSSSLLAAEVISTISKCTIQLTHKEWRDILDQEENYCMVDVVLSGQEAEEEEEMMNRKVSPTTAESEEADKLWTEFHVPNPFRTL